MCLEFSVLQNFVLFLYANLGQKFNTTKYIAQHIE